MVELLLGSRTKTNQFKNLMSRQYLLILHKTTLS